LKEAKACIILLEKEKEKIEKKTSKMKDENVKLAEANIEGYMKVFKKVTRQHMHFTPTLDVNVFNLDK